MEQKSLVASYIFDTKRFEHFSTGERKYDTYTVDGAQVSKEEWARRQDEAIAAEMARLKARND